MKKDDFIRNICEKCGLTQKDANKFIQAFTEAVREAVAAGKKVQLIGFGAFESRRRGERKGYNPATGTEIKISAATFPVFRAGKAFKDAVNAAHKAAKNAEKR